MTLAKISVFLLKSVGCFQNPLSVSGQCFIIDHFGARTD